MSCSAQVPRSLGFVCYTGDHTFASLLYFLQDKKEKKDKSERAEERARMKEELAASNAELGRLKSELEVGTSNCDERPSQLSCKGHKTFLRTVCIVVMATANVLSSLFLTSPCAVPARARRQAQEGRAGANSWATGCRGKVLALAGCCMSQLETEGYLAG